MPDSLFAVHTSSFLLMQSVAEKLSWAIAHHLIPGSRLIRQEKSAVQRLAHLASSSCCWMAPSLAACSACIIAISYHTDAQQGLLNCFGE